MGRVSRALASTVRFVEGLLGVQVVESVVDDDDDDDGGGGGGGEKQKRALLLYF